MNIVAYPANPVSCHARKVRLNLTGYHLEAFHCDPSPDSGSWFNDDGTVKIDYNKLAIASYKSGHLTTRTDTIPGGYSRRVDVRFSPYLDDDKVRFGKWTIEREWETPVFEQGPGGNGSWSPSSVPIGKSRHYSLRQGKRTLTFTASPGYTNYLPPDRILNA